MPVQDGLQNSGTLTATTTGAVSAIFTFRSNGFSVTAATSGGCFVDFTGGVGVLATTSAGYPLAAGEKVVVPFPGTERIGAYYTGFSILGTAGVTSTVRWLAL